MIERWRGLSLTNANVDEMAKHVQAAQRKKGFPGKPSSGKPLTYLKEEYAAAQVKANRAAVRKACKPLKRPVGYDCDEYPFASTLEGGARGPVSVKMIPESDNARGGGLLVQWYSRQRILHFDLFWVLVQP